MSTLESSDHRHWRTHRDSPPSALLWGSSPPGMTKGSCTRWCQRLGRGRCIYSWGEAIPRMPYSNNIIIISTNDDNDNDIKLYLVPHDVSEDTVKIKFIGASANGWKRSIIDCHCSWWFNSKSNISWSRKNKSITNTDIIMMARAGPVHEEVDLPSIHYHYYYTIPFNISSHIKLSY